MRLVLVMGAQVLGVSLATLVAIMISATGAQADVDPMGAFVTSVPMLAPPFHGLEPRLGLSYSSSGPTGWVGRGWSLTGLSTLRRESDRGGFPDWDGSDTFSLDGRVLVACPSSADHGSVALSPSCRYRIPGGVGYTTQVESYQRISYFPAGEVGDPRPRWVVWRTDGVRATYEPGLTTSRGTLEWRLTSLRDLSGNTVVYDWSPTVGAQVSTLKDIRYGDVDIRFQTETRPDPISVATGAGLVSNSTRLQAVDEFAGGYRVRAYALKYTTNPAGSRESLLASVQQYGSDAVVDASGVSGPTAMPPITFAASQYETTASWTSRPSVDTDDWAANWPSGPDDSRRFTAVLNGGTQSAIQWPGCRLVCHRWVTLDFNGDARADFALIRPHDDGSDHWFNVDVEITLPDGGYRHLSHRVEWPSPGLNRYSSFTPMVADVDGDGVDDLTLAASGYVVTVFGYDTSPGIGIHGSSPVDGAPQTLQGFPGGSDLMMGDVTGDGRADIVSVGNNPNPSNGACPGGIQVWMGTGSGDFDLFPWRNKKSGCWPVSPLSSPRPSFQLADVNGDRKADVVAFQKASDEGPPETSARIFTAIADGLGGFTLRMQDTGHDWGRGQGKPKSVLCPRPYSGHSCHQTWTPLVPSFWADADGDGRSDLIVLLPGGPPSSDGPAEAWTYLSNADGSYRDPSRGSTPFPNANVESTEIDILSPSDWETLVRPSPPASWFAADLDGDGDADLADVTIATTRDPFTYQKVTRRALSDRKGAWEPSPTMPTSTRDWSNVCGAGCDANSEVFSASDDINGDGRSDILFAHDTGGSPVSGWTRLDADVTPAGPSAANVLSGDVNADGRQDLVYPAVTAHGLQVRVMQQRVAHTYQRLPPVDVDLPVGTRVTQRGWLVADVNGDGRIDLVNLDTQSLHSTKNVDTVDTIVTVLLAIGEHGWRPVSAATLATGGRWSVADVNGDTRDDLVRVTAGLGVYALLGQLDGTFLTDSAATKPEVPSPTLADTIHWQPVDVNGDGSSDLVHVDSHSGTITTLLRHGDQWRSVAAHASTSSHPPVSGVGINTNPVHNCVPGDDTPSPWPPPPPNPTIDAILSTPADSPTWRASDINGDGASDLSRVSLRPDGIVLIETLRSNGDGTYTPRTQAVGPASGGVADSADTARWAPADVDHDERADLVRVVTCDGSPIVQAALSDGDGRWTMTTWRGNPVPGLPSTSTWRIGDRSGTGRTSALRLDTTGNGLTVTTIDSDAPRELIHSVTNGLGATTFVDYSPGTDMLNADATAAPQCRVPGSVAATPVVTAVTTHDTPSDAFDLTTNRYACPRYSSKRRRFVAWSQSWTTHAAAVNRPASTEHVTSDVFPSGIIQPVLDKITDEHGQLLRATRSDYVPVGLTPETNLMSRAQVSACSAGNCATSTVELSHDKFGNITRELARAAGTARQRETDTSYLYEHPWWLNGLPHSIRIVDPAHPDQTLRSSLIGYDNDTSTDCQQMPPRPRGLITTTRAWDNALGRGGFIVTSQACYDDYGNQTSSTDANGNTATTTFDPQLHLYPIKTCNALKQCTKQPTPWNRSANAPETVIDANQAATQTTYDPLGRIHTVTRPSGAITTIDYQTDSNHGTTTTTTTIGGHDAAPWSRTFADGLGRNYLTEHPASNGSQTIQSENEYSDASSRPWRLIEPAATEPSHPPDDPIPPSDPSLNTPPNPSRINSHKPNGDQPVFDTLTYDALGRPLQDTHPDGSSVTTHYLIQNGLTVTITRNEADNPQTQVTDGWGTLTSVKQPSGSPGQLATTHYSYDALGELTAIADPANNTIRNTYDTLGRETSQDDPDRGISTYNYDPAGNLRRATDARGRTLEYGYDKLNRRISKTDLATGLINRWHYDQRGHGASIGKLTTVHDDSAQGCPLQTSRSLTYNTSGDLTTDLHCVRGVTKTFRNTYDKLGRLKTLTYPDNERINNTYDAAGHIYSVSGYVTAMHYNARGQIIDARYPNATVGHWDYDHERGWLAGQHLTKQQGRTLFDNTTTHDPAGVVTNATSTSNKTAETYTYDQVGRLTTTNGTWRQHLTYDDLGNITANSRVGSYTYPYHRHCSTTRSECAGPHAVTYAGDTTYRYDPAGNMTRATSDATARTRTPDTYIVHTSQSGAAHDTLWNIAKDQLGNSRLWTKIFALNKGKSYPSPSAAGHFTNPQWIFPGQRLSMPPTTRAAASHKAKTRKLSWNSDGQLTRIFDTNTVLIKNVYDANGTRVQQTSREGITNFYGPLAQWSPKTHLTKYIYAGSTLIARSQGTHKTWYTLDDLGSPRLTTDANSVVSTRTNYGPFGQTTGHTRNTDSVGYTGHHSIGHTNLIDMAARTYDPQLARMLSADSLIPSISNPQSLNRYSYAYNNPTNYTDPSGHLPETGILVDGLSYYDYFNQTDLSDQISSFSRMKPTLHWHGDPLISSHEYAQAFQAGWLDPKPPKAHCAACSLTDSKLVLRTPRPRDQTPTTGMIASANPNFVPQDPYFDPANTMTAEQLNRNPEAEGEYVEDDPLTIVGRPKDAQGIYRDEEIIGPTSSLVTPESAMRIIQNSPNLIFPFIIRGAEGETTILLDHVYFLDSARFPGEKGNPVLVIQFGPTSFTFLTEPGHFRGAGETIRFEIFASGGQLILAQQGTSAAGLLSRIYTLGASQISWRIQASNLRSAIYGGERFSFPGEWP